MISDDANASPLQPDGLADSTEPQPDRDERPTSTRSTAIAAEEGESDLIAVTLSDAQIVPQPSPGRCGVCGQSHWELYAHLPIETEAYLAAVADLNRRSRSPRSGHSKSSGTPIAPKQIDSAHFSAPASEEISSDAPEQPTPDMADFQVIDALEGMDETGMVLPQNEQSSQASPSEVAVEPELEVGDRVPSLAEFPHGTAWRCYDCEALSLVWPIDIDLLSETVESSTRRRSSPEFRDSIKDQIEACLRSKVTDSRAKITLKSLRVLDLNLGRGTRADRNLALLHELGLAKHQIFGIGDDASTIDSLNFAGYQAYYGTIDRVLDELPDDYFHLVLGFNVIEYCSQPSALMQRLTVKLRPGARVLLELSNPAGWQAKLFRHGYWSSYQHDRHILLGEKALRILGQRCNFTIDTLKSHPEPQAWETSSAAWTRRKRHPLGAAMQSGLVRGTLVGIDRLRAALGMASSRYSAVLVRNDVYPPIAPSLAEPTDGVNLI
jgi:SAM-dependent methyltransferase